MSATVLQHGWHSRICGLALSSMLMMSCTTSSIDTALTPEPLPSAPESTVLAASTPQNAPVAAPSIASQAVAPQNYPNINNEPVGETAQLSEADQQAMRDRAERARQSVEIADETAAYAARLKKLKLLARTHAQRTQQEIEGN